MYNDLPVSAKSTKSFDIRSVLELKDKEGDETIHSPGLTSELSKRVSFSTSPKQQLDSMLVEYETELRNDYRMIGETRLLSQGQETSL